MAAAWADDHELVILAPRREARERIFAGLTATPRREARECVVAGAPRQEAGKRVVAAWADDHELVVPAPRREARERFVAGLGPTNEGREDGDVSGPRRTIQRRRENAKDQWLGPRRPGEKREVIVCGGRCSVLLWLPLL